MHERLFSTDAGPNLDHLADGDVAVVYIEQPAEESNDSYGGHRPLRRSAPPSLTRAVPDLTGSDSVHYPSVYRSPSSTSTSWLFTEPSA